MFAWPCRADDYVKRAIKKQGYTKNISEQKRTFSVGKDLHASSSPTISELKNVFIYLVLKKMI